MKRVISVFLFPGFEMLDVFGPLELFKAVNSVLASREGQSFRLDPLPEKGGYVIETTSYVGRRRDGASGVSTTVAVKSSGGPKVEARATFSEGDSAACSEDREQRTTFLVPGGRGARPLVEDKELLDHIASRCRSVGRIATVCTGTALLAKAGVLDGREATTNKQSFEWVVSQRPKRVRWQKCARWIRCVGEGCGGGGGVGAGEGAAGEGATGEGAAGEGGAATTRKKTIWTSSGVSAGMDMALAIIAEDFSLELAKEAADYAEYVPNWDSRIDPFAGQSS